MAVKALTAIERVRLARANGRPTARSYIERIFTEFIELHGDRRYADDASVLGGIAYLEGRPVTVIAIEKGRSPRERIAHNFGAPHPEGYRKALRLAKQAEKFARPVICLVDTSGAYCGIGAEERGQAEAIAECLSELSALRTPIISLIIGEGGSGGALALAVADRVWMLENAIYSVISPEGCASILWKDPSKSEEAADSLKLTAADSLRLGVVEEVIPEDDLGTDAFYARLREKFVREMDTLLRKDIDTLLRERYDRFRGFGVPEEV